MDPTRDPQLHNYNYRALLLKFWNWKGSMTQGCLSSFEASVRRRSLGPVTLASGSQDRQPRSINSLDKAKGQAGQAGGLCVLVIVLFYKY